MDIEAIKKDKTTEELLEFGIINIDKPSNPTSFDISDFVRKKLGLKKTSHFGTLDPKVTGVLPIALSRACKLTGFFLGEDKEYVGIMRLHEDISVEAVEKVIKDKFMGKIKQTPPKKSRVKRQEREREIISFEILEKNGKDFVFLAEVQGGTYIRKLISDLGDYIKIGAHMLELRRVRAGIIGESGIFTEDDKKYPSINLYDFEKAVDEYKNGDDEKLRKMIIPAEIVGEVYPSIQVKEEIIKNLFTGKPIMKKDFPNSGEFENGEIICVFSKERFIGMYKVLNDEEIFAKAEFVKQEIKLL